MKNIIPPLIIFFLLSLELNCQVNQEWVARYNGPINGDDKAYSLAIDNSGNVYVTGYSAGSGTGFDYATIKYNSSGMQQWVARYNGPGNGSDEAYSVAVDSSGNVYVTGRSTGNGTDFDFATIKYNSSGMQQWVARCNGAANLGDEAYFLKTDGLGNVYVTGRTWGNGTNYDYATIKYNSSGLQEWIRTYNGPVNGNDAASSLAIDGHGNVYVTGYSNSNCYQDYATIKYDSTGVQQWVRRFDGECHQDVASSVALDNSGNVYVTGYTYTWSRYTNYLTIKYNSSGVQQWWQMYYGPNFDAAYSLTVDDLANVYVTGTSLSATGRDYVTVKYDSLSAPQWEARYNGPGNGNDDAYSIAVDKSGNVYVTGYSNGTMNEDYATIKYNLQGAQQWVARYNGPGNGNDDAYSIAVDKSGNVYVTGYSAGTDFDYATIKYSQPNGIQPISNEIPDSYKLYQNYPNPFNSNTKFKVQIVELSKVRIIIYDILGRELEVLLNEELKPGIYEIEWDAANYPSGTCFYRLVAGDFIDTKKMVLLK